MILANEVNLMPNKPHMTPSAAKANPIKTDSVPKKVKQSLKEWAMAGGGVPQQYKDRRYDWFKKVREYAAGGEVKAAAHIDGNDFVEAAQAYGLKTDNATLNKIVARVNKGEGVREAAKNVAQSRAVGGAVYDTEPDVTDSGKLIQGPAFKEGGKVKKEERAAFGVFPQMKPKRSRQDPEAAKNVPVDLARGFVAGTLGMPGDIESLVRMLPGLDEKTVLPTSEDILKRIPFGSDTPAGRAASGLGVLGGGFYTGPGSAARAITSVPKAVKRAGKDFAQSISPVNVIKPKGGNWLGGRLMGNMDENVSRLKPYRKAGDDGTFLQKDLDRATQRLQMLEADPYKMESMVSGQRQTIDDVKKKMAINDWVDSNLKKYVKNQMGTPEDPLRMMFDRRAMEIEEAYAKDIKRADRALQRAADEVDPRRKANLERESERIRIEAAADRDFAREHITHVPGRLEDYSPEADYALKARRQEAGFPAEGLGQTDMAKRWETLTDDAIASIKAGEVQASSGALEESKIAQQALRAKEDDIQQRFREHVLAKGLSEKDLAAFDTMPMKDKASIIQDTEHQALLDDYYKKGNRAISMEYQLSQQNPFISKLDPETQLYSGNTADMGFDHVIDILKQDVMAGRIRPEQLNRVSIEDAVRRTADFDQEQARKMAAATIKATEGMPTYKDYPEAGYKWIELAQPKLPEGWRKSDIAGEYFDETGRYQRHPGEKMLEDALKYEGDTMGHCVGGYCPDVLEGRSRIFSLRDRKGEPHVTIEVQPAYKNRGFREGEKPTGDEYYKLQEQYVQGQKTGEVDPNLTFAEWWRSSKGISEEADPAPVIRQIKGKQNEAPSKAYLPYVQDFVKSDKWSDVGDLQNTGLYKADPDELGMFVPSDPRLRNLPGRRTEDFQRAKEAGLFGDQTYLTRDEWEDILRRQIEAESGPLPPLADEGMAAGGVVRMQAGGVAKMAKGAKKAVELGIDEVKALLGMAKEAPAGVEPIVVKPAERAAAGKKAAELIKSQPPTKASEALGQAMEKGFKKTTTTQADRTRVGGGNIGGAPFSAISEADPAYAGKVWGVMDEGTAARLKNLTTPDTAWTTMLGSANQLKTNPIVFDKLKKGFLEAMKAGNLTPELEAKINHNLALTFGEGAEIRDPKIWKQADTFEKRAALADLMMGQGIAPGKGGVALGGEKSGKGVIFKPTDILKRETEPGLLHPEHGGSAPTFAAGPRLFSMDPVSEFRPDLHPGFPTLIGGKDLGVNMIPTPTEVYLPEYHRSFKKATGRKPGYYDLALGMKGEGLPSQKLDDEYIRHLLREGYKKGGRVGGLTAATKSCSCND